MKLRSRVSLEVANLKEATQVVVENHYLHRGRTMAQMPYWILLDDKRCGVLLFALPRLSVDFQGHGPMNLVELARMWIDPDVQGQTVLDSVGAEHTLAIASCAIGMSLRQIRQDWHGKYPHLPEILACVSWADDVHHEGTIYRAANFTEVGKSGGSFHGSALRRNGGHDQKNPDYLHTKTAFLYGYARVLTDAQKAAAYTSWEGIRPTRTKAKRVGDRQLALAGLPKV